MNKLTCCTLSLALAACALVVAPPAQSRGAPLYALDRGDPALTTEGKFIDQRISEFMAAHHIPGMTLAIVQAPYIPRSSGYGRASAQYDELASTRTPWNIGPISQAFTDVAVMQLYEQGTLDIRAPIGKYVPGLPAAWQPITVYELMQHSSGIADYRKAGGFSAAKRYRTKELVNLVAATPLEFETGMEVRLSATNFALLAMVVEKTSGMSYQAFVRRYQIEPLQLRSTFFASELPTRSLVDRPMPDRKRNQHARFTSEIPYISPVEAATGYGPGTDEKPVDPSSNDGLPGFSDLWSSAEDISFWDVGLAGSILVNKPADRELIYAPTRLRNGKVVPAVGGWEFTHHPGFMEVKGDAPGFSAYLSRFTSKDELVCVTLLSNREGVDLTGLARDIADSYMPGLGSGLDPDLVINQESKFSVDETFERFKAGLAAARIPLFATIDHGDNASKAGLAQAPAKVLVFGNPAVGTKLMQDNVAISLELPLRVAIWQDPRGRTWVSYHDVGALARDYGIKDPATVAAISKGLAKLTERAVNVYDY